MRSSKSRFASTTPNVFSLAPLAVILVDRSRFQNQLGWTPQSGADYRFTLANLAGNTRLARVSSGAATRR